MMPFQKLAHLLVSACVEGGQRAREGLHENENTSFHHFSKSILFTPHLKVDAIPLQAVIDLSCFKDDFILWLDERRLNKKF